MSSKKYLNQTFRLRFTSEQELLRYVEDMSDESEDCISKIDWDEFSRNVNADLRFLDEIILRCKDKIKVKLLCKNTNLNWNIELIKRFEGQLDWMSITWNPSLSINEELVEQYGHHFSYEDGSFWESFCSNSAFPIDISFCARYSSRIDWRSVGLKSEIEVHQFSYDFEDELDINVLLKRIEFIKTFKDNWCYDRSIITNVYSGVHYEKDSIFDNPHIDWKTQQLRDYFIAEIREFNKKYFTSI